MVWSRERERERERERGGWREGRGEVGERGKYKRERGREREVERRRVEETGKDGEAL